MSNLERMELFPYDFSDHIEELELNFGTNKKIPPEIKLQTLIALSYYPKYKNLKIQFSYKKINSTMVCLPDWRDFFKKAENRKYKIHINNHPENQMGVAFEQIPFNAQIGVIGHELAHIEDYLHKNIFSLLLTAFLYLTPNFRSKYEKKTDLLTINHGLGWQLYDFTYFVLNSNYAAESYKKTIQKYYYNTDDLFELINRS